MTKKQLTEIAKAEIECVDANLKAIGKRMDAPDESSDYWRSQMYIQMGIKSTWKEALRLIEKLNDAK